MVWQSAKTNFDNSTKTISIYTKKEPVYGVSLNMVGKKDKRSNWKITPRYKPDLIGSGHVFVHFSTSFKCVVFDRQQKKLEKKEQCHRLKSRQKVNSIWFFGRVSRVDFQLLGIRRLDYYLQKQLLKSLLYLHVTVTKY